MSLKTLGLEIEKWVTWKDKFVQAFADATYPLPNEQTKFLGAIHSRFNRHKSKAAVRYHERISQIDDRIENELIPRLRANGCLFNSDSYEEASKVAMPADAVDPDKQRIYTLARIPDFAQVTHIAAAYGKPVFSLNEDDLRAADLRGNVKQSVQDNISTFDAIFDGICEKIKIIIEND